MADVSQSIEINRPAADVFAYLDDLTHQADWQESARAVRVEGGAPTRVGTRVIETRRVPGGVQTVTYEVTEHQPGRGYAFEGQGGPVRISARITVNPHDADRCTVEAEFSFAAGGMGRFILPLVRREAQHQLPADLGRLKALLESAT
jgi:uncharacterized membrane protein